MSKKKTTARDRREIANDLLDALQQARRLARDLDKGAHYAHGWLAGNVIRCVLDLRGVDGDDARRRESDAMARLVDAATGAAELVPLPFRKPARPASEWSPSNSVGRCEAKVCVDGRPLATWRTTKGDDSVLVCDHCLVDVLAHGVGYRCEAL